MTRFPSTLLVTAALAALVSVVPAKGETTPAPGEPALTVHMRGSAFDPQSATVTAGQTVLFVNDDDLTHNVTADDLKSGDLQPGKGWSYKFEKPGTYRYACTYHAWMKGEITAKTVLP